MNISNDKGKQSLFKINTIQLCVYINDNHKVFDKSLPYSLKVHLKNIIYLKTSLLNGVFQH